MSLLLFLLQLSILYPNFSYPLESPCICGRAGSGDCHSENVLQDVVYAFADGVERDVIETPADESSYHVCYKYKLHGIGDDCSSATLQVTFGDEELNDSGQLLKPEGGFPYYYIETPNRLTR